MGSRHDYGIGRDEDSIPCWVLRVNKEPESLSDAIWGLREQSKIQQRRIDALFYSQIAQAVVTTVLIIMWSLK